MAAHKCTKELDYALLSLLHYRLTEEASFALGDSIGHGHALYMQCGMRLLLVLALAAQVVCQYDIYDTLKASASCVDKQEDCQKWARQMPSQCIYNVFYMASSCAHRPSRPS